MRMRGRLRDSARAAHRRHLLIRHVEAGSVKLSGRAGVIGMASSPTKPCRRNSSGRTDGFSQSPHKLPHRAREIARNRPSSGQTPNKNVGNPRFKKNTPETQNGRTPTNQCIRDKLPHKSGTSSPTSPSQGHLPKPSGTSSPARKRPTCPMPQADAATKSRTPEWVCGRCTMRLPGPPPAFDASATCGFPIGMDYRYPQMTMDRDVERCTSVPLDGNARVSS